MGNYRILKIANHPLLINATMSEIVASAKSI
jgi:hypothetical protein